MPSFNQLSRSWRSDWGPRVFVWGVWAALSYWIVDFVKTFGVDFPFFDEWEMVPTLVGAQPITLRWLWSQHNEHRIFIPRLVYLAVEKLGGYDFRAGMYFDALALSVAAAALIVFARRARGCARYTDAFLPLILLNLGQAQNVINSFQITFISGTLLSVTALSLSALPRLGFRAAVALGVCTVLMPLIGGHGLALVPALSVAVVITGWSLRREPGGTWKMLVVWTLAALAIGLMGFYFVDYSRPAKHPLSHSLDATLDGAVQFLTVGLGSAARLGWPETKRPFLVVFGASVLALLWVAVKRAEERGRALRLLLFLGALLCLALGISRARVALTTNQMFASRYTSLATPFWCALYFAWELVDDERIRRFAQTTLLFCAAAFTVANHQDATTDVVSYHDHRKIVYDDIRAGFNVRALVDRDYFHMYYGGREVLMERLRLLRDRKIGVFARLKE